MTLLDENIDVFVRRQLEKWRIRFRRIGAEVGRFGMDDREEIIPLLHSLNLPTFFTRDQDFYNPWLRHPGYCLVYLQTKPEETARCIRRFLRHPKFRTKSQRMGNIVRIQEDGITAWQVGKGKAELFPW